jgi:TM2 domain-containing membrane protein YozV
MKSIRLAVLLVSSLLLTNTLSYAYVIAPQAATGYETASTAAASGKELKKEAKKEVRAQKKAERRARFLAWIQKKMADNDKQLVAILLTLFLGGLGIHRVYLGSEPIIILWYLITLGGFFGIIPLIDFIRLILGQVSHYEGNSNLFRAFQSS